MAENKYPKKTKNEIYKCITDAFVKCIEDNCSPYHLPYKLHTPISAATDNLYKGVNNIALMSSSLKNDYESDRWITGKAAFKKEYELKTEHKKNGTEILFYKQVTKDLLNKETGKPELDDEGKKKKVTWFLPKTYHIYNLSQFDNVPELDLTRRKRSNINIDDAIQTMADDMGVTINHGFKSADFDISTNTIRMPSPEAFESESAYNVTLLQQLIHVSGLTEELHRIPDMDSLDDFSGTVFDADSAEYAKEQFIGSLGAVMLASMVEGLDDGTTQVFNNRAAEAKDWIGMIKSDPKIFVSAAREAQKSVELLIKNIPELIHQPDPKKGYKKQIKKII